MSNHLVSKFLEAKDRVVQDLIAQLQESHGDTKQHQEIKNFCGYFLVFLVGDSEFPLLMGLRYLIFIRLSDLWIL